MKLSWITRVSHWSLFYDVCILFWGIFNFCGLSNSLGSSEGRSEKILPGGLFSLVLISIGKKIKIISTHVYLPCFFFILALAVLGEFNLRIFSYCGCLNRHLFFNLLVYSVSNLFTPFPDVVGVCDYGGPVGSDIHGDLLMFWLILLLDEKKTWDF